MKLLIVESPTKARKIYGILKKHRSSDVWCVLASYGHLVDLPKKSLGVDIKHDFEPTWEITEEKALKRITKEAKNAEVVFIGTDDDREGEAIACHLRRLLSEVGVYDNVHRVRFNEITTRAILSSVGSPGIFDDALFESQITRRLLDRLIGYVGSPILWKQLGPKLSMGRVQSCALALLADRLRARWFFESSPFWEVVAELADGTTLKSKRYSDPEIPKKMLRWLKKHRPKKAKLSEATKISKPWPCFVTSFLLREATQKLDHTSSEVMALAQKLYEGGHITYMRTDSFAVNPAFSVSVRKFIEEEFGKQFVPKKQRLWTFSKGAHEAIRPTRIEVTPSNQTIPSECRDLYRLIWRRSLAAHGADAELMQQTATIKIGKKRCLVAEGLRVVFAGHLQLSNVSLKSQEIDSDALEVEKFSYRESKTEPDSHWTEASLVDFLRREGIGRPSTYSSIIEYLMKRGYAKRYGKAVVATLRGFLVADFLRQHVGQLVDTDYTKEMEQILDQVADTDSGVSRLDALQDFWGVIEPLLEEAKNKWIPCFDPCKNCGAELDLTFPYSGEPYLLCNEKRKEWKNDGSMPGLPPVVPGCGKAYGAWINESGEPVLFEPFTASDVVCRNCGSNDTVIASSKFGLYVTCKNCNKKWPYVR